MGSKKIKFKGTENFKTYINEKVRFDDGEEKSVDKELADYLLKDFSEYFIEIKPQKKSKKKEVKRPFKDKMVKKGQSKTK